MGAGLQPSLVPLFVGKGIDTKLDPRLVPEGSLLELENLYMLRTGELRWRNGFNSSNLTSIIGVALTVKSIFRGPSGLLGVMISSPAYNGTSSPYVGFLSLPATTGQATTLLANGLALRWPFPGLAPTGVLMAATSQDTVQSQSICDSAVAGNWIMVAWIALLGNVQSRAEFEVQNLAGEPLPFLGGSQLLGFVPDQPNNRICCAAGGSRYLVVISQEITTHNIKGVVVDTNTSTVTKNITVTTFTGGSANNNFLAMASKPGSNNVIIAARAAAGGVSIMEWNPATQTAVTTTNIAGADANLGIGILDNQTGDGNYYLVTSGTTAGVVCRTINSALSVTTTLTLAVAALAGQNPTGYVASAGGNYVATWTALAASPSQSTTWSIVVTGGVAGSSNFIGCTMVMSKCFRIAGGGNDYYWLGAFSSPTQSSSFLMLLRGDGFSFVASQFQYGTSAVTNFGPVSVSQLNGQMIFAIPRAVRTGVNTTTLYKVAAQSAFFGPCEIGGSIFLPGSPLIQVSGGVQTDWSEFQFCPELPTLTQAAGGSLTALGTYQYVFVYVTQRPDGSLIRSAPSVPVSITLTGANQTVQATFLSYGFFDGGASTLKTSFTEIYRAGPAAAGAVTFNKVAVSYNSFFPGVPTTNDTVSDALAATGEILYTTGGVLDNNPPPACTLMTANNGRAFVVNSENPTELWFSKQRKVGEGVYFNPLLRLNITGDGYGAITALSAMDGRVIVFKSNAIYVISGDGPDDTGGGSFNPPQAVTLNIGTTNPASVVTAPDGIMFQAAAGIYLLNRGLSLTYLGAPVEKYTLAENVVGASIADGYTQVRLVMPSGRCLVWDYHHQRWYTWKLRVDTSGVNSTVVGCAQIQGGVWCYALADGSIFQETPGTFSDVNGTTTAIVPRVGFPQVNVGGIAGFQRVYGVLLEGEYVGDHTLQVSANLDLGTVSEPTRSLAITTGPYLYEVLFANQKCTTIQVNLTCSLAAGSGGFRLSGASLVVGLKRGTGIPWTKRLT